MLGRTTNRFSYETFVLPGGVKLQVKLLFYPQHRASCTMTFWDGWSSLVMGTVVIRGRLTETLPPFLALPRSPAPGSPRAPLSRRSPRPQPSAHPAPPGPQSLAPQGWRLVPPTRPPSRLAIGPLAPRAADWRPPQPAPGSPNARRPCAGIGRAPIRPALRSPARQLVSRAESLRGPWRVAAAPGR